ncbi:MAG: MraY family glycosyltransferase [Isosphaeraceae bacterium]|nr:MraY family glycosyltransferase [Isosphaeraceae bacterium]
MTLALIALSLVTLSFAMSAGLCALVRLWAPRLGLLDRPGGHKGHATPTPLGGGVAIWLTVVGVIGFGLLAMTLAGTNLPAPIARNAGGIRERSWELGLILALATGIMTMGLLDDRRALSWQLRLSIQFGVAIVLAASGIRVTLFPPLNHPLIGGALTVVWVVGLTNAFNLLDNMDGLAAGVGLIAAALFAGAQVAVGSLFAPAVLLVLVGALAGFLVHNRNPARLFMGDAGSNFLGFLLGALTVAGTYYRYGEHYSKASVLAPLLVMAVPLYDTLSVIVIRRREGRSVFQGDRRHFSHRLVERGLTPRQAVRTIDLVTLASGLGALLLHRLEELAWVVVAQTACLLGVVAILEVSANRPERGHGTTASPNDSPLGIDPQADARR